jgi:hypothetical protein
MAVQTSDHASDKLQATIIADLAWGKENDPLATEYDLACARWFYALSTSERVAARAAAIAFARNDESVTLGLLRDLPPAPRCPL